MKGTALHFVRMAAWGMFDIEALPKRERSVRLHQMREFLFREGRYAVHVGLLSKKPYYILFPKAQGPYDYSGLYSGQSHDFGEICRQAMKSIEKIPPYSER